MSNKKNVILYCRVNRNDQKEGIEKQKNLLIKHCKENGYSVIADIEDVRSGMKQISEETYALLEKYKEEAKTILVSGWDRISRNIENAIVDKRRLEKMGFNVCVVDRQVTLFGFRFQKHNEWIIA
jgi:DNA invertase Pin-like site-specific DNA recombinase